MSDALTDIRRDERRFELVTEIFRAVHDFRENPTPNKARKLINLWEAYKHLPRGYWSRSNAEEADENIRLLKEYLETGEVPAALLEWEG